jgi:hypothetical protein
MSKKKKDAILITHQFLEESDLSSNNSWKLKVFKYSLKKYRLLNPNTYLILVGHGSPIPSSLSNLVDWCYWHEVLITNEINWGHPISVNIGIQHCEEKKISFVTKVRLDSINLINNINDFCNDKIKSSNGEFIVTSFNHNCYSIMDLFFSGDVLSLKKLYEYSSWEKYWPDFERNGTYPLAYNYYKNILNKKIPSKFDTNQWLKDLEQKVTIMSPSELRWINLREYNFLVVENGDDLILKESSKLLSNFFWVH